jgi:hypothetical protein
MDLQDLKKITLETKIYHPFLGEGFPTKITENELTVKFSEGVQPTFATSGSVDRDKFLKEIFLYPVYIARKP